MLKITVLIIGFLLLVHAPLNALNGTSLEEEQPTVFRSNHIDYRVTTVPTGNGENSDIQLSSDQSGTLTLNTGIPGMHLLPVVTVSPGDDRFVVSWYMYQHNNKQLYMYDSRTGATRLLPLHGFKTAFPVSTVYTDDEPQLLVFMGNNSNNTDLFIYHLGNGTVMNITNTPHSEIHYSVFDLNRRVFIEADTLHHHYRYRIKKSTLRTTLTKKSPIQRPIPAPRPQLNAAALNTVVGFGDSITWGTIRMDPNFMDGDNERWEEMAYLKQLERLTAEEYDPIATVNLGVPGDQSWMGQARLQEDFDDVNAAFCLMMFGTNDVLSQRFDPDQTIEVMVDMTHTITVDYGMYVIVSTIPPQKSEFRFGKGVQAYVQQTLDLNAALKQMGTNLGIPVVDSYTAFMNGTYYWEDLLELYKGNHPSPQGHTVMAQLFQEKILEVPPAAPTNIRSVQSGAKLTMLWDENKEFDIDRYRFSFGYQPNALNRTVETVNTYYQFIPVPSASPFDRTIYVKIQALDKAGNASPYSSVQTVEFE